MKKTVKMQSGKRDATRDKDGIRATRRAARKAKTARRDFERGGKD